MDHLEAFRLIADSQVTGFDFWGYQHALKGMCQDVVQHGRGFMRSDGQQWRHIPLHEIDASAPAAGGES